MRIRKIKKKLNFQGTPMMMRKMKKSWRKNENPRNDTERKFQENAEEFEGYNEK